MIRAIIVDDEEPSRQVMCNYLRSYCSDVEVVATAANIKTAYRAIQKHLPDVVFLDIEMPDGKGFDLLTMFERINFSVIFVTAYSDYAIRAFRVNAVDYLLKPVKVDELVESVKKIRNGLNPPDIDKLAAIMKSMAENTNQQPIIMVSSIKGYEVLKIRDIIMCMADGYCTNFYMSKGKTAISSKNLKQYESQLADHHFVRVHHSYIVNLNHVTGFTRQGEINLTGNHKAFLGDTYKDNFMKALKRFQGRN